MHAFSARSYKNYLREDEKCNLSFALAKMYEDIGKLDEAFAHLSEGNALQYFVSSGLSYCSSI